MSRAERPEPTGGPRRPRVLVAGGGGFLGARVVSVLTQAGIPVAIADLKPKPADRTATSGARPVDVIEVDLRVPADAREALSPWRWEAVVNLAGPLPRGSVELPDAYPLLLGHVGPAIGLASCIPEGWPGRIVHASSMTVYGTPTSIPVAEDAPLRPLDQYGAAKALAEEVLQAASRARGLKDLWLLRFPGLFAHERRQGAIHGFVTAALRGDPLRVLAAAPTPWDVLHVDDAAQAVRRSVESGTRDAGPVNVSYGESVELVATARHIAELGGARSDVVNETGVDHPVFRMDISKARKLIDWPPTTLDERLEELFAAWSDDGRATERGGAG